MICQSTSPLETDRVANSSSDATRVLVVDDCAPWRRSVVAILEDCERLQVVGEAVDGVEAVEKALELIPDLILMDIGLPRLNGIDAAIQISELVPHAKILFVTQNHDPEVVNAALINGAHGYILKLAAYSELLLGIEAVLRGETFVGRPLKRQADQALMSRTSAHPQPTLPEI